MLTIIEEQDITGSIPAEKVGEALLEMMHARIVCYNGGALNALAIYDTVAESVRPIRSGRAQAVGIK